MELCRQVGSRYNVVTALYAYGLAWWQTNPEDALATIEENLSAFGGNEDAAACRVLALLGQLRARNGDIPEAFDVLHRAMTIASTDGDRAGSAVVVARGVRVLTYAGSVEEAAMFAGIIGGGVLAGLRPLPPHESADYDDVLATLKNDLGPDRFDTASGRGARMNYDEVVTFVLHTLDRGGSHGHREVA